MHTLIFVLIWVVAALSVFFGAFYLTRDKDKQFSYQGKMPAGFKLIILLAAGLLLLGVPAVVLSATSDRIPSGSGTYTIPANEELIAGRNIFRGACASCHTLSAANARGVYGPSLDESFPAGSDPKTTASRVESAIKTGGATGLQMPKDLLSGADAKQVSAYIAAVAGK
jgi:mono/diheme cytochrome c family protein